LWACAAVAQTAPGLTWIMPPRIAYGARRRRALSRTDRLPCIVRGGGGFQPSGIMEFHSSGL